MAKIVKTRIEFMALWLFIIKKDFRVIFDSRIWFWYYVLLGGGTFLSKYSHITSARLSFSDIKKKAWNVI